METITSRSFQISYQRLEIPVVVKAKSRTLGTWYPKGTEPPPNEGLGEELRLMLAQRDAAIEEAHQLRRKIEGVATKPAANVRAAVKAPTEIRVGTASYSSRPFTPVPHPGKGK